MTCLICGKHHPNPLRGGKVTFLAHCFKFGHKVRAPKRWRPNVATSSRSQRALKGWGAYE